MNLNENSSNVLVLASTSPRRRQLLEKAGIDFIVDTQEVDESPLPNEQPAELVARLAKLKAQAVKTRHPKQFVLGADTVVILGQKTFGKPHSMLEATDFLRQLSGRTHQVLTGVAIISADNVLKNWVATTSVAFRQLDDDAIRRYFEHTSPLDKAGAYGIQDHGELIVESISGSLSNIIGLPVEDVLFHLANLGFTNKPT
ncbi:MAG: septum formation protein Maf [Lentisphaerae bacterium]|jgi:septum formation protein|nr:septum formation protein Maf [Lentisphaerota bacterium]